MLKNYFILLFYTISLFASKDIVNSDLEVKKLYLSYKNYPNRVFTNQRFSVELEAIILYNQNSFNKIITTFTDGKNIQVITQEPKWKKVKDNIYKTKLIFKAQQENLSLPTITLALFFDDEIIDYISLEPLEIDFEKIAINQKLFSNIIASDLDILQTNTKQYDNSNILATIVLEAKNSNLEDLYFNGYNEQGIESYTDKDNIQRVYYHIVVPIHTNKINFTYYNTKKRDFILKSLDVSLKEDLVSTQTNINPYNSNILLYKQILVIIVFSIFFILLLIKRNYIYLFITIILLGVLVYLFIPNKKIVLPINTKIYILPTKNSTIFKITTKQELVEILNKKDKFIKIMLQNQNIGWIKDDSQN